MKLALKHVVYLCTVLSLCVKYQTVLSAGT
jgi:hypothetical protein